jgi:hypothetical protein
VNAGAVGFGDNLSPFAVAPTLLSIGLGRQLSAQEFFCRGVDHYCIETSLRHDTNTTKNTNMASPTHSIDTLSIHN